MSLEQLKAFLEKVKGDTSLQEKLKGAADSDAFAAIAKEAGFRISADELPELSAEELEICLIHVSQDHDSTSFFLCFSLPQSL